MNERRLPILAYLLMLAALIRQYLSLLTITVVTILAGDLATWRWVAIAGIIALVIIVSGLRYWRFTYAVGADAVTINSGLVVKKVRHIPYARIQTVQRQQWVFLRPFGLESVTLETAGKDGQKGEARLYAVPLAVDALIQAHRHQEDAPVVVPPQATFGLARGDLNAYALTSLGFVPILLGALGLFNRLEDLLPKSWTSDLVETLTRLALLVVIGLGVLVLVVGMLSSYLTIMQRYYHFRLTTDGDRLTTERGLLNRVTTGVRLARIQAVRLRQTLLRQWLHLSTVELITAGNAGQGERDANLVILPVVKTAQALATTHRFVPWVPVVAGAVTTVPRPNWWYYARNRLLANLGIVLVAGGLGSWQPAWWPWLTLIALLWLGLAVAQGLVVARFGQVAIVSEQLLMLQRGRGWGKVQYWVRRESVQAVAVKTSVWLTQKHGAHLQVNIRNRDGNSAVTVRYLNRATAMAVMHWYRPETAAWDEAQ